MGRGRDRHTETLVPIDRAGFGDTTRSVFDPATRRVSTAALRELVGASIDADSPTTHIPMERRPPPIKRARQRVLEELKERRSGEAVTEGFGRYALLGSVGKGGMAEVRLAAEKVGDDVRLSVIKRIVPGHENADHLARVLREEARITKQLRHPHVVALLDAGEIEGAPFLAFELIDGVSLRELMEIMRPLRVPLRAVLEIGRASASALAHAHSAVGEDGVPLEVVHRDATPQNVLVSRDGIVKLVDFGIARFQGREHETRRGHVKGKLGYMAPEQCRTGPIDGKADVFALALVLIEMIAGERVLPPAMIVLSESESLVRKRLARAQYGLPPRLTELLVRMAALDAKDRPTAGEVEVELEGLAAEITEGETLAELVAREVFSQIEPFTVAVAIDPPPAPLEDPTVDPTDASYARTLQHLRPLSGPRDDAPTRMLDPLPAPAVPAAEEPGRSVFFAVLAAAVLAFLALLFVLTR